MNESVPALQLVGLTQKTRRFPINAALSNSQNDIKYFSKSNQNVKLPPSLSTHTLFIKDHNLIYNVRVIYK